MPESPSEWGPDEAGGDGTLGMLGPAIVANPGEKVHLFVKNNLGERKHRCQSIAGSHAHHCSDLVHAFQAMCEIGEPAAMATKFASLLPSSFDYGSNLLTS